MDQEQFKTQYDGLKEKVNGALEDCFTQEENMFKSLGPEALQSLERIKNFSLRGGKRLRPILVLMGYRLFNGPNVREPLIIKASVYAELLHNYLLIHSH